jgi:hypothetical protein
MLGREASNVFKNTSIRIIINFLYHKHTLLLHYKVQQVNALHGKIRCLL